MATFTFLLFLPLTFLIFFFYFDGILHFVLQYDKIFTENISVKLSTIMIHDLRSFFNTKYSIKLALYYTIKIGEYNVILAKQTDNQTAAEKRV